MLVSRTGAPPEKRSVSQLRKSIDENVDISFPIYNRIARSTIMPNSHFLPVVS